MTPRDSRYFVGFRRRKWADVAFLATAKTGRRPADSGHVNSGAAEQLGALGRSVVITERLAIGTPPRGAGLGDLLVGSLTDRGDYRIL